MPFIRQDDPKPGFYLARLGRGKPLMPVMIWGHLAARECCEFCSGRGAYVFAPDTDDPWRECQACNGRGTVPTEDESIKARFGLNDCDPFWIWTRCANKPIGLREYRRRIREVRDAVENDPDRPEARPDSPIELGELPPILPRR